MKMPNTLHVVVRFSDRLFSIGNVIEKHNDVVSRFGYVWFGKIGMPVAQRRIDTLNEQIQKGIQTHLFLVQGNRKQSNFYQANLLNISRAILKSESKCHPDYYLDNNIKKNIQTWFKITKINQIDSSVISKLRAIGSVYSLSETLVRSSTGYFLVQEGQNVY